MPLSVRSCLAKTETSSTRNKHANISASILSEHCGRATALHAITRDWPPSMAYTTYPAPPSSSSRWQLPSNWPTIWMEGWFGVSSMEQAKITSSGPMCWSAVTVHRETGELGQAGWIMALGRKPAKRALVGAMRLSYGCPSGRAAMVCSGAIAVVAVQRRSGSVAECKVTASLLVVCMWHGWHWLSVSACRGRMSGDGSGRKRVGIAWRQLSCRRVSHSGTLRVTEDVECCIPPCSNRRRRNWWRTWLATTHPAVLVRASWSKDRTVWVGEDRVLATRTGTMQKRAQCCEELSPCPHATQGGKCLLRSIHESGTTKDPRTESAIGCQWDVSGIFHLAALWRVVAFMLWSWQHLSQAGAKLSPSGYRRVRTPHSWQGCSACRDPARRSRRHSSSSSFTAQRNTAKRATPWTANLGTAARLVSHFSRQMFLDGLI